MNGVHKMLASFLRPDAVEEEILSHIRQLSMFVRVGDAAGQVQACDGLMLACAESGMEPKQLTGLFQQEGVLQSIVVILQADRTEPCRAAIALLAHLAGMSAEQRKAVLHSGALRLLVHHLRRSHESALLREGARVLAALAADVECVATLLREGVPRALIRLCRSEALQAH